MTKERKLAIQMWQNIRDMISEFDKLVCIDILLYKDTFCAEHRLWWSWNCLFCQYMPGCSKCPLVHCGPDSWYAIVKADYTDKNVRIATCNNIIRALGGEA